jgi:hypothetical protein
MATQVQFRGGTTSEHSSFTGAAREVTVDTTKDTVVIHDGSTAGGFPLAKETGSTFGNSNVSGNITFADSSKAIFGGGSDLQIYHDGSNSYISEQGTGHLRIRASNLQLQDTSGNVYIEGVDTGTGGTVTLYHNASAKLATSSTGIAVGVVPNTGWSNTWDVAQVGLTGSLSGIASGSLGRTFVSDNAYNDSNSQSTSWQYQIADQASQIALLDGTVEFRVATAGSANADITWNQAVTVDNSGNLLVGKTTTAIGTVGFRVDGANGFATITRDGYETLILNRKTSDGDILVFNKDGASVGSIATRDTGALEIGSGDVYLQFNGANDWIKPMDGSGNNKSGVDLGTSGARFKDLYLSGGVNFGSTGGAVTSKTLDDYEEGTWTPVYKATSQPTVTYAIQSGQYTKVGQMVQVNLRIATNGVSGGSGTVRIDGLPFASVSTSNVISVGAIFANGFTGEHPMKYRILNNGDDIYLYYRTSLTGNDIDANTQVSDLTTASGGFNLIEITATYFTS